VKYSYLWLAGFLLLISGLALWRIQAWTILQKGMVWLILVVLLMGIFWVIRPSENYHTLADIDAQIGGGKPTLLELYSEY
jgi:hypothetical protein